MTATRSVAGMSDAEFSASLVSIRNMWLTHGLSTEPADHSATEAAVTQWYQIAGCRPPEFRWLPSPPAAVQHIVDAGFSSAQHPCAPTVANRIADVQYSWRKRLDARLFPRHLYLRASRTNPAFRHSDPIGALAAGVEPQLVAIAAIRDSLRTTMFDAIGVAIKTQTAPLPSVITWYGQQECHHAAYYDAMCRHGLAHFETADLELLELSGSLVRSAGWWWAFDHVCVLSERPVALHTEPTPADIHGERRLHHAERPAIEFADDTAVYVDHGTIVPEWVITDPTAERIAAERNIEIRRCAIERIGWDRYIDDAGLRLVDESPDPGNPGFSLQLFDTPSGWRTNTHILLVVNGSRERDGQRRRYGLRVPGWPTTAVDAAAWTYGLRGHQYATLARRT